jgi:uncharacterized protein (TIGR00266 family)
MDYELDSRPAYTVATIALDPGETITAEAGALVSHTDSIEMETGIGDEDEGFLESMKDSILGDESLFRNRFTAQNAPGEVAIAPTVPGDVSVVELTGNSLYLQSGAYVAAESGVSIDTDIGGLDTLLGGEGLFFLEASGTGTLFLGSFGGVVRHEVPAGEEFTVDSGHVVAWDSSMSYDTQRVGGLKETLFSEEGLVMRFTGPGEVFVQTRNYDNFISDIVARMPSQGNGGGGDVDVDI